MTDASVPPPDEDGSLLKWATDSKARLEERNWDDEGVLKGQQTKNNMLWLKVYGYIVPAMMIVFTAMYLSVLIVYTVHYTTTWCWLSAEQLSKIQSVIFSGSVGAFVASVVTKQNSK